MFKNGEFLHDYLKSQKIVSCVRAPVWECTWPGPMAAVHFQWTSFRVDTPLHSFPPRSTAMESVWLARSVVYFFQHKHEISDLSALF